MGRQGGEGRTSVASSGSAPAKDGESTEDNIEASLEALVQDAERLLDRPYLRDWPKDEDLEGGRVVEVIESSEFVTLLVDAPGCSEGELSAEANLGEVKVRGPDFMVRRALPCPVDRTTVTSELRNGVYSVRMSKFLIY